MKLNFSGERVLAVVAHPDDAELLCAGTLARARADGAAIGVCVFCKGEKGQPARPIPNLEAVRHRELVAAAKLLGAEVFRGGVSDGTLADVRANREKLTEIFRKFRPTLVIAHAPEDYHPDHRAVAALADAASWYVASQGYKTKSAPTPVAPALWFMDTINAINFLPDFYVDISLYIALKEKMLSCHRSQLARGDEKDFAPLLDLMRRQCRFRGSQAGVKAAEAFRAQQSFKRARAW